MGESCNFAKEDQSGSMERKGWTPRSTPTDFKKVREGEQQGGGEGGRASLREVEGSMSG